MEFATIIKGTKLIVVLGHSKCGAVSGAIDNAELGNLTQLVNQIKPAIIGDESNKTQMLEESAKNNVRITIENILEESPLIAELVKDEKVKIIGAYYNIDNGKVEFLD